MTEDDSSPPSPPEKPLSLSSRSVLAPYPPSNGSTMTAQLEPDLAHRFSLLELASVLSSHLRKLILVPLLAGMITFGIVSLFKPIYTATGQILAPQQQQSTAAALLGNLGGLAGAGSAIAGLKNPSDQWVGLLKSRTIADAMIDRFKLQARYDTEFKFQTRNKLEDRTKITAGKDGMIDIEVDDEDPKTAADMVNAYVEELTKLSNSLAVSEAAQRRVFFERQLKQAKEGLIAAEVALRSSGISESVLKTAPSAAVATIAELRAQVSASEVRLQVMQGRLASDAPEYKQAQIELASLRRQLAQVEKSDPTGANASGTEYVARFREFKYYETLFDMMARQFELAKADEAREGALIQFVDRALPPEWKSRPKRLTMAIGTAFATLFALLVWVLMGNAIANLREDPMRARMWNHIIVNLRLLRRRP